MLPARNGGAYLRPAVESMLAQTLGDFELILINDGSTDDTGVRCRAWAAADARVRVIDTEGIGLVAALNLGIRESKAELIARMDADDVSLPERLELSAAFLDAHPEAGVVGTWYQVLNAAGQLGEIVRSPCTHEAIDRALLRGDCPISHPASMMRRSVVESVGLYRASVPHAEDYDLFLRLAEVSRLANIPHVLLQYRRHNTSVSAMHRSRQIESVTTAWGEALARRGLDRRRYPLRLPPERLVRMRNLRSIGDTRGWITECLAGLAEPQFIAHAAHDVIAGLLPGRERR